MYYEKSDHTPSNLIKKTSAEANIQRDGYRMSIALIEGRIMVAGKVIDRVCYLSFPKLKIVAV